jgi:transcriptional regulator with XRE-family HTH domain
MKQKKLEKYKYDCSGISVVLTNSVFEFSCEKCLAKFEIIRDLEGLGAAIAVGRVLSPVKLNGKEIRFLRKALGLKAMELASKIETTPETLSRYEQDKMPIGLKYERQLRMLVAATLSKKVPAINIDMLSILSMEISPIRNQVEVPMSFELIKLKEGNEKKKEWDILEEDIAA